MQPDIEIEYGPHFLVLNQKTLYDDLCLPSAPPASQVGYKREFFWGYDENDEVGHWWEIIPAEMPEIHEGFFYGWHRGRDCWNVYKLSGDSFELVFEGDDAFGPSLKEWISFFNLENTLIFQGLRQDHNAVNVVREK